jgi:hypothetical protein
MQRRLAAATRTRLVVVVAVSALAVAGTRLVDRRSQAQRDYEAVSKSTKVVCIPDPVVGGEVCPSPNSIKADLSVAATAIRTGDIVTVKAVVRNHQWANGTASGFWMSALYHPDRPKRYPKYRSGKLESGQSAINCSASSCDFPAPVPPGQEVAVEMTWYAPDEADLTVSITTLDTYSSHFLELHEEDNRIVVPVANK